MFTEYHVTPDKNMRIAYGACQLYVHATDLPRSTNASRASKALARLFERCADPLARPKEHHSVLCTLNLAHEAPVTLLRVQLVGGWESFGHNEMSKLSTLEHGVSICFHG